MSLFIAVSVLSACGIVTIRDKEIYADLGEDGARRQCTLTECGQNFDKATWDNIRSNSEEVFFCTDTTDMNQFLVELESLCTVNTGGASRCDYETKQKVAHAVKAGRELLRYSEIKKFEQRQLQLQKQKVRTE